MAELTKFQRAQIERLGLGHDITPQILRLLSTIWLAKDQQAAQAFWIKDGTFNLVINAGTQDQGGTWFSIKKTQAAWRIVFNPINDTFSWFRAPATSGALVWSQIAFIDSTGSLAPVRFGASQQSISISGILNDFVLDNFTSLLRVTVTAGTGTFTGLAGGSAGRTFIILNASSGSNNVKLNNEDGSSTAANRVILPGGATENISPGASVLLIYDAASSRWRRLGA